LKSIFNKKHIIYFTLIFVFLSSVHLYAAEKSRQKKESIPFTVKKILFKVNNLLNKDDVPGAIKVLEAFQAKQPKGIKPGDDDPKGFQHHYINLNLGNCWLKQNNPQKASVYYRAAVKRAPYFSPAWMNLAKCCYDLENFSEAGACFLKGFETAQEKQPETLYYSAVSFMTAENFQRSLEIFEKLFSGYKENIRLEWKQSFAQLYLTCNMPLKALPYLEEIVKEMSGEKSRQWKKILLHQYICLEMESKALAYAEKLTRQDPVEPDWWKALSYIHLVKNRYEKGLVPYTIFSYIKKITESEEQLLADLNFSTGIPAQAAVYYENIIAKKQDSKVYEKLVNAYIASQNYDKALESIEKAIKFQCDGKLLMIKGQILIQKEKYKEAMHAYENAAKNMKDPGRAWLMAGYAAWNCEDLKKARHAFKKAAEFDSQREKAIKAIDHIERMAQQSKEVE
jgi:tetratricopeptide (TPR) repeat protein